MHQNITIHYTFIELGSLFLPPGSGKKSRESHLTYLDNIDHVGCDVLFVSVYSICLILTLCLLSNLVKINEEHFLGKERYVFLPFYL